MPRMAPPTACALVVSKICPLSPVDNKFWLTLLRSSTLSRTSNQLLCSLSHCFTLAIMSSWLCFCCCGISNQLAICPKLALRSLSPATLTRKQRYTHHDGDRRTLRPAAFFLRLPAR